MQKAAILLMVNDLKGLHYVAVYRLVFLVTVVDPDLLEGCQLVVFSTTRVGVRRMGPSSFQWCPVTGQGAMGTN